MREERIRALAISAHKQIDEAISEIGGRSNAADYLSEAQTLLGMILEEVGDPDDPSELDF